VLAATLSPSYGIYSGYEHMERVPVRPGSEEYLDSEKYEAKERALDGPLLPLIARVNQVRRESPPLQRIDVRFLQTANPALIAYAKGTGRDAILVCVNLDPHSPQEGLCVVPPELGLPGEFPVRDLVTGALYTWSHGGNYVRLDPEVIPFHLLRAEA
jgi:starch synthase (maltosyl-transferring)